MSKSPEVTQLISGRAGIWDGNLGGLKESTLINTTVYYLTTI